MTEVPKKGVACKDCTFLNDVIELYNSADVKNVNEAVTVVFHAFLLECGFIPEDVSDEDKYKLMPKGWNTKGVFEIKYVHHCCPSFTCCVTLVPLYNNVSIHGIICVIACSESININVNMSSYLKQRKDFSNFLEVFCNLEELSRNFKDKFCLPLLNLVHETAGKRRLFGFPGLYDELKVHILQLLPVEGVMSMSAVNKNLYDLTNSSLLWKNLFQRDFAKGGVPDIDSTSSETNWKQIYKTEYLKRKRRTEQRPYIFPRHRLPEFYTVGPDYDTDISINFDPPFTRPPLYMPPFLQPRLPPYFRRIL